jgi:hypothetical protein
MTRRRVVTAAVALFIIAVGLLVLMVYLLQQGLAEASMWATLLVLPLTVIIAVAGLWAAVVAARSHRSGPERAGSGPGPSVACAPTIGSSGSISQDSRGGLAAAHSGTGDIMVTRSGFVDPSGPGDGEESRDSAGEG